MLVQHRGGLPLDWIAQQRDRNGLHELTEVLRVQCTLYLLTTVPKLSASFADGVSLALWRPGIEPGTFG